MNAVTKIETPSSEVAIQATPAHLLQMAVQQGADLDRLEKLMGLQERWEANEARKAFVQALTAFKSEPVVIEKTKLVSFSGTNYKHATLAEVVDAAAMALSKHGLTHRWTVKQADDRITVGCVLTHEQGHSESIEMSAPPDASGSKNKIQQIASTVTYLERYTLLAITGLAAKDMDDDGKHGAKDEPVIDEKQLATVLEWIETSGADVKAFCNAYKIEAVAELQVRDYNAALNQLKKKAKAHV